MDRTGPHAVFCAGWHIDSTCTEATAARERFAANPFFCPRGRNGYHLFDRDQDLPPSTDTCSYGCGRTWGELKDWMDQ